MAINLNQNQNPADRVMDMLALLLREKRDEKSQIRREAHDIKMFEMQQLANDKRSVGSEIFKIDGYLENAEFAKAEGAWRYVTSIAKNNPELVAEYDLDSISKSITDSKEWYKLDEANINNFFNESSQPTQADIDNGRTTQMDVLEHKHSLIKDIDKIHPALRGTISKNWDNKRYQTLPQYLPFWTDSQNHDLDVVNTLFSGLSSPEQFLGSEAGKTAQAYYTDTLEDLGSANDTLGDEKRPIEQLKQEAMEMTKARYYYPALDEAIIQYGQLQPDFEDAFKNSMTTTSKDMLQDAAFTIATRELSNAAGMTPEEYLNSPDSASGITNRVTEIFGGEGSDWQKWDLNRQEEEEKIRGKIRTKEIREEISDLEESMENMGWWPSMWGRREKKLTEQIQKKESELILQDPDASEGQEPLSSENIEEVIDFASEVSPGSTESIVNELTPTDTLDKKMHTMFLYGNKEDKSKAKMYFDKKNKNRLEFSTGFEGPLGTDFISYNLQGEFGGKSVELARYVARGFSKQGEKQSWSSIMGNIKPNSELPDKMTTSYLQRYWKPKQQGNEEQAKSALRALDKKLKRHNKTYKTNFTLKDIGVTENPQYP